MNKDFKFPTILWLDFEFNNTTHECVNLVSCVTHDSKTHKTRKFWLHKNDEAKNELRKFLSQYETIGGYACVAEARSFYSLNLDPLQFKWVDLFLEWRGLTNHNDKLSYGNQLVDGKVKYVKKMKPKWERTEEEAKDGFRPTHSLAEATYKLTTQIRDTAEKDECRKLIISAPKKFDPDERKRILDYNAADVEFLPTLWKRMREEYASLAADPEEIDWEDYWSCALWRGRYSAHTAIMESVGYPINLEATRNFSKQIPSILADCQADINSQFRGQEFLPFKWNAKTATYSWNQKGTREWLISQGLDGRWMRTDGDQLSLALEAFERHFQFKHDYPRGNLGAQMVRFLKLKQSLYGFATSDGKRKTFWDAVGPDGRVRPYMNIYGAQSGRSQPAATGFMFLKPAWMRALVEPAPGHYLAGIDYGQQEFFIAALKSEDKNMVEAYLSGDPYLYMAKQAGTIPESGTRKTHEPERDLMKATTLGILFNMTKYGLSAKLTADTGREHSEEDAQDLINTFEDLFPVFTDWRKQVLMDYEDGYAIVIEDGWTMWSDNDNPRSVTNVPIQGLGAAVMRKAVDLAVAKGVKIIFTLHDAIYLEGKVGKEKDIVLLGEAMREAFAFYFEGSAFEKEAKQIKLDYKAWGPSFPEKGTILLDRNVTVPVSRLHIDSRSIADHTRFSKYFSKPETDLL